MRPLYSTEVPEISISGQSDALLIHSYQTHSQEMVGQVLVLLVLIFLVTKLDL
jgi:hypothetical protein